MLFIEKRAEVQLTLPQQRGFTLLEALVVIGVIAVISAFFFANWTGLQTRPNLESAMRQIEDVVLSARGDVLLAQQASSYRININDGVVTLSQQPARAAACPGNGAWVIERSYTVSGVLIAGPRDLCFNSDGSIFSSAANTPIRYQITRDANERAYRLTLWPTSRAWQREERVNANANWVVSR